MKRDLVVLVPDKDIEQSIAGILARPEAIGIRSIREPQFLVHPQRDPGVYHTGHQLLAPFVAECRYALACFDRAWEGAPSRDPGELARHVENNCRADWGDRIKSIVIDPEIEVWVWSSSPHVAAALGWRDSDTLREWLLKEGVWSADLPKPPDPKATFEAALRQVRLPPSSAIFRRLASTVSFQRCADPAFGALRATLRGWFPAH